MNLPPKEVAYEAAKRARWKCALCHTKIKRTEEWVTDLPTMLPIHHLCAIAHPNYQPPVKP